VTAARGYRAGQRWAAWAALLIGVASAPQASASGFHDPYTIPDVATAALGVLLTVAILATAGRPGQPVRYLEPPGPAGAWSARPISWPSPEPGRPSPAASSPGEPAGSLTEAQRYRTRPVTAAAPVAARLDRQPGNGLA
jgi:hypothetical protein